MVVVWLSDAPPPPESVSVTVYDKLGERLPNDISILTEEPTVVDDGDGVNVTVGKLPEEGGVDAAVHETLVDAAVCCPLELVSVTLIGVFDNATAETAEDDQEYDAPRAIKVVDALRKATLLSWADNERVYESPEVKLFAETFKAIVEPATCDVGFGERETVA